MSNDLLRNFILSHTKEINSNDFKPLYSEALDNYGPTAVIPKFTDILIDAGINPLLYMDCVPSCYAYRLNLSSVAIPNNVTSIDNSAFYGCSKLTNVTIPNSVTSINNFAFYKCKGLTSIIIPNRVTSIGNAAFSDCSGLTSITIPDSVTDIGDYAFEGCSGLTSVTIGDGVTSIGSSAFNGCTGLTSITIPDRVTSIGKSIFTNCNNLKEITFNGTVKQWNAIKKAFMWSYGAPENIKIICKDGEVVNAK